MSAVADLEGALDPPRARRPAARRRPLLVALLYAHRAAFGLAIAAPFAAAASDLVGAYPRGDAELEGAGGLMLVEIARLSRPLIAPLAASSAIVAILAIITGFFLLGALIAGLGREGPLSARFVAGRAASSFSALVVLGGAALFAEAALAALVVLVGQKVIELLHLGYRAGDGARGAVVCFAALMIVAVGVVHDLARVAAVHEDRRFYAASTRAFEVLASAWRRACWSYAWRGALSLATIGGAAWLARRVGTATAARLAINVCAHQAAIAAVIVLRASWLAAAVRLVDGEPAKRSSNPPEIKPDPSDLDAAVPEDV